MTHPEHAREVFCLHFNPSPYMCDCGHSVATHYEQWPAVTPIAKGSDLSYLFVRSEPILAGCNQCSKPHRLRIDADIEVLA